MSDQTMFTSAEIAKEAKRVFGDKVKSVSVAMKYRKEANDYIEKIDSAHKRAAKSNLVFK